MRIHDSLIGGVLLLLSLAVLWHIQGFPPAAGQQYGPALFPGLIAIGLGAASAVLAWQGLRTKQPWPIHPELRPIRPSHKPVRPFKSCKPANKSYFMFLNSMVLKHSRDELTLSKQ